MASYAEASTRKASVLGSRAKMVNELPFDKVFVIYGKSGSGKTTLAASFPKTAERPLYILDVLENGTTSISLDDRENTIVVPIDSFEDMDNVLTDFENGWYLNDDGKKVSVHPSTIVIDSATQLEYLMKQYLMAADKKDKMNLNLWGQVKNSHDMLWNMAKYLSRKLDCYVVTITHEKDDKNEDNPQFDKVVPSLTKGGTESLTAKASFIWYTTIESEDKVTPDGKVERVENYVTYIGPTSYLVTKCRKPKELRIPQKVRNLTFDRFNINVIAKIEDAIKYGLGTTGSKDAKPKGTAKVDTPKIDLSKTAPKIVEPIEDKGKTEVKETKVTESDDSLPF